MSTKRATEYKGDCSECPREVRITRDISRGEPSSPAVWAKCPECGEKTVVHKQ